MMRQISSEELRNLRAAKEMLKPSDRRHGTPRGYNIGCRCDRCRLAYKAYKQHYVPKQAF